jgi:hypothetical protein
MILGPHAPSLTAQRARGGREHGGPLYHRSMKCPLLVGRDSCAFRPNPQFTGEAAVVRLRASGIVAGDDAPSSLTSKSFRAPLAKQHAPSALSVKAACLEQNSNKVFPLSAKSAIVLRFYVSSSGAQWPQTGDWHE